MSVDTKISSTVPSIYRTVTCNQLDTSHIGHRVSLAGWCHRIRDHGGVLFIDLRDSLGITQCVSAPQNAVHGLVETLRSEWVVKIVGTVRRRLEGTENADLATGDVEVEVQEVEVLGPVDGALPIPVFGDVEYPEDQRLRYRFLDMRRPALQRSLRLRAAVVQYLRQQMIDRGFLEVWTPILTASSPEGARDFLVPSRLHPGKFYALPQAPQQFKQLLMVGGVDRYFQIAPCFRDEAARADRSPGEFYQLDIEMAFVTQDDVFGVVEPILRDTFRRFGGDAVVDEHFPQIPYDVSMLRYGNDKPDLRNPLVIDDLTDVLAAPEMTFGPFREILDKGGVARVIVIPPPDKPRKWFKDLEAWAIEQGAKGLGYITAEGREIGGGPLAKFLTGSVGEAICNRLQDQHEPYTFHHGAIAFLIVADDVFATKFSGLLRTKLGEELDLIEKNAFRFCWITDFPMFEKDEHGKVGFSHNPFSMPQGGLQALETRDPLTIKAFQYDIVCNGIELSSGAIRNHRVDVMEKAFEIAGYGREVLEERFGGMLSAFRYGAPPHGGIAPGVDRIVMMLNGSSNLREIVAFPMNQQAQDLLMGAPSEVTPEQMAELHIRPTLKKG